MSISAAQSIVEAKFLSAHAFASTVHTRLDRSQIDPSHVCERNGLEVPDGNR